MNFFFGKSPWRKAIEKGLASGKLSEELDECQDLKIKSRADGEAICWGLERVLQLPVDRLIKDAHELALLFQKVDGPQCAACDVLRKEGTPLLVKIFDRLPHEGEASRDTVLFILKIFGMYGTTIGALKIAEAAQRPLYPDAYMWSVILSWFRAGHPETEMLHRALSDPLPPDFIGVTLLDSANAVALEKSGSRHTFDSPQGKERLRAFLENTNPDKFSYARSATTALPFISNPERDFLLRLAMQHADHTVRLKAAWAAAKLGKAEGYSQLVENCRDYRYAMIAAGYLTDLGREDLLPPSAKELEFQALSGFANWLAHPNELGRLPDQLEIYDHRELRWPPSKELKPFWLLKFRAKGETALDEEDVGCGLVGSITFSFFSYELHQRPPEDGYAIHCYWEMEHAKLIEETDVQEKWSEYASLLQQWRGAELKNARITHVAEISPQLKYGSRLVALAYGNINGEDGWVVLDGEQSKWYPVSEQPRKSTEGRRRFLYSTVLKIHVGRRLLGFEMDPDRKKYFVHPSRKPPEEFIVDYESYLETALRETDTKERQRLFRSGYPLCRRFDEYVDAIVATNRQADVLKTIKLLEPNWDHVVGEIKLEIAALRCGYPRSEADLVKKLQENEQFYRYDDEINLLAETWCAHGKGETAKELLIECLQKALAFNDDKSIRAKLLQNYRDALTKLFPGEAQAILKTNGLLE